MAGHLIFQQEAERRRIARELHDDLVQRTAAVEISLTRLQDELAAAAPAVLAELRSLTRHVSEISDALYSLSHRLTPAPLADLGIEAAFQSLVEDRRKTGSEVTLILRQVPPGLSFDTSLALYRIAEEALDNAARHAPGAPVRLELNGFGNAVRLSVHDAGPGFVLRRVSVDARFGLLRMQLRARLAGGRLRVRTRQGSGTSVMVRVPLAGLADAPAHGPHTSRAKRGTVEMPFESPAKPGSSSQPA